MIEVAYFGPGLAGKTTSMQRIHASADPASRTPLIPTHCPDRARNLSFSMRHPAVDPVVHVSAVVGPVYSQRQSEALADLCDGVIFLVDSQPERIEANLWCHGELIKDLGRTGRTLADVPLVFQYNKCDLPDAMSVVELDRWLNPDGRPAFASCARRGEGVLEAFEACLRSFRAP